MTDDELSAWTRAYLRGERYEPEDVGAWLPIIAVCVLLAVLVALVRDLP